MAGGGFPNAYAVTAPYDVAVLGLGPAGLCAALRLRQMGRSVVVLERARAIQGSVGELLTPGVRGILEFLGLPDALIHARGQDVLSNRVIWSERHLVSSRPSPREAGIMVDRALFDGHLAHAALNSGADVLRGCCVESMDCHPSGWCISFSTNGRRQALTARFIVDARGRAGSAHARMSLAPRLLALRTEFPRHVGPCEVSIEALPDGWLWGAPTCQGSYRVLAFCDPVAMRGLRLSQSFSHPSSWLQRMLAHSRLFSHLPTVEATSLRAYDATPYLHRDWWGENIVKVGDAALALDPLSSSGVEKGMRFALQAVLAINTLLSSGRTEPLAKEFLQGKMHESCGRHLAWTQHQYGQTWCVRQNPFWQARAAERPLEGLPEGDALRIINCRALAWAALEPKQTRPTRDSWPINPLQLLDAPALACDVEIANVACAVGDLIELKPAVIHPNLSTPVVFVHGRELVPLLREIGPSRSYADLLERWSTRVTAPEAISICAWALRNRLLTSTSRTAG